MTGPFPWSLQRPMQVCSKFVPLILKPDPDLIVPFISDSPWLWYSLDLEPFGLAEEARSVASIVPFKFQILWGIPPKIWWVLPRFFFSLGWDWGFPQVVKILPTPTDRPPPFLTRTCLQLSFVSKNFKKFYLIFLSILTAFCSKLHQKALFYA